MVFTRSETAEGLAGVSLFLLPKTLNDHDVTTRHGPAQGTQPLLKIRTVPLCSPHKPAPDVMMLESASLKHEFMPVASLLSRIHRLKSALAASRCCARSALAVH